jgi:hypothetical protein
MQSTAIVIMGQLPKNRRNQRKPGDKNEKSPSLQYLQLRALRELLGSGFRFCLQHLASTVKTGRTDVMTQVNFTRGGLNRNAWNNQSIVRTVHTALGRGFFVLLDSHNSLLGESAAQTATLKRLVKALLIESAKPQIIAQTELTRQGAAS